MTIGDRIKARRKELGITQGELAERMGYRSKSAICKAETVEFNPTTDRVREFAKALECTPAYLMGWEENQTNHYPEYVLKDGTLFSVNQEDEGAIKLALQLLKDFRNASPEVQMAVRALLKDHKSDPEHPQ